MSGKTPSSGLIDQRLVPRLISLVESYCPSGGATIRLMPTMVRWTIRRKLLRCHRGSPIEVHREPNLGSPCPNRPTSANSPDTALRLPADHGHDHSGVGRSSGQAERPRKRKRRGVDRGARLFDGRGRIERQIAPVEIVGDGDDVQPLGEGPIRAGLELLRGDATVVVRKTSVTAAILTVRTSPPVQSPCSYRYAGTRAPDCWCT